MPKQYSVTSGTVFAYHKLPLQDYLAAIAIYTNSVKGHSALQMSRELNVQYKTAFVLVHKIRESIFQHRDMTPLEGEVEIDGGYFGGYLRPKNEKKDRIDRRLVENKTGTKRCIMVLRQRGEEGQGAVRTLTMITNGESTPSVLFLQSYLKPGSIVYTDEFKGYSSLKLYYDHRSVDHSQRYSAKGGINNNQSESYFARMRRCKLGQHYKITNKYLITIVLRLPTVRIPGGWIMGGY